MAGLARCDCAITHGRVTWCRLRGAFARNTVADQAVAGDGRGTRRYNRAMPQSAPTIPWLAIAVVVVAAFAGGAGLSYWQRHGSDAPPIDGLLWPDPPTVPAIALTDHNGAAFTLEQLRGHWTLLFFGFTHCPDVCPTALQILAQAHVELKHHAAYAGRGQVVFVSVDPERDTSAVLRQYVNYFHREFIGVTAPVPQLNRLTAPLGAIFMKSSQGGPEYSVDHSAGIFFIDPAGRLVDVITPPHTVPALVARFDAVSQFIDSLR